MVCNGYGYGLSIMYDDRGRTPTVFGLLALQHADPVLFLVGALETKLPCETPLSVLGAQKGGLSHTVAGFAPSRTFQLGPLPE
jgi:hypothetical protein